jgi:peroxiredoxin
MPSEAPLFTLFDSTGNLVALEDHRGKVVLINFWATWCPPCIEEMPAMQELKESFVHRPFEILAINMAENQEDIDIFLQRTGFEFSFPLLLDPGGKVADQYHVKGLPTTMIVDRDGLFAFGGVGARDWNSPEIQAEILPLFD